MRNFTITMNILFMAIAVLGIAINAYDHNWQAVCWAFDSLIWSAIVLSDALARDKRAIVRRK